MRSIQGDLSEPLHYKLEKKENQENGLLAAESGAEATEAAVFGLDVRLLGFNGVMGLPGKQRRDVGLLSVGGLVWNAERRDWWALTIRRA
ncbi:hypothetical protein SUGI_0240850 [Cryptomeria japonica]|nr:hypothetical protein SUGI_0240850 [Cryptomeria japonica]